MKNDAADLLTQALKLPGEARASLADALLDSLDSDEDLSPVGEDVIAGLKEVLAHARGEITLPYREYEVPERPKS